MTELQTKSGAIKPAPILSELEQARRHFIFKDVDYVFKRPAPVEDFLRENPFLISLILEAREQIRRYFGADHTLALQLFYDPENPQNRQLILLIQARDGFEKVRPLLDQLNEGWWFDAIERAQGLLDIIPEYL
ncbi:MAG: hypothetical protein JMDDDDMK_00863 [Acidobacteria bacterium]|nr:hypothetical protein [Acidobacteriota bacterium]